MPKKVLVGYWTKLNATTDVAQEIGDTITKNGIVVDVRPMNSVEGLTGYDAVILGSAIRMGQWLPEAKDFVSRYQGELNQIPAAIFSVHILNQGDDPESQKGRATYTAAIKKMFTPISEGLFAGKIDPTQLNFFERLLFKVINSPAGDYRDWDSIRRWAEEICKKI